MKKILILLVLISSFSLLACDLDTTQNTDEIEVGYSFGGGDALPFAGFLAFTIQDPVISDGETSTICFEYGHDYNAEEYDLETGIHSIAVFVSNNGGNYYRDNGEFSLLYEEVLGDFVSDQYLVSGDTHSLFSKPIFSASFELSITLQDIPYESGTLYYVLSKDVISDSLEEITMIVYQVIHFTKEDGNLSFYE